MGFLAGKRLLITGVLSNRSIAYGIARCCHREGAELAFSFVGERFKDRVSEFAAEFDSKLVFDCDVADDAQIQGMFDQLGKTSSRINVDEAAKMVDVELSFAAAPPDPNSRRRRPRPPL